jgi:methylenetetrahydrofolate reductase (NADPH)
LTDTSGVRAISDIYAECSAHKRTVISVEFFPPKTPKGEESLFDRVLPRLAEAKPDFCSVTYGAGGSTRDKTLDVVDRIQRDFGFVGMAHLTCLSTSATDILNYVNEANAKGIRNLLALRGDPPSDNPAELVPEAGFDYAYQLIDFIKQHASSNTSIGCAGFPEGHIACTEGRETDWQRLRNKVDHGAQFILTQLFFDNDDYFRMVDYLTNILGVNVPITPGILPILSSAQIKRFSALCGASLPKPLLAKLDKLGDDDEAVTAFGIEYASKQCEALLAGGAPGLHLYSLNRSKAVLGIVRNLGLVDR